MSGIATDRAPSSRKPLRRVGIAARRWAIAGMYGGYAAAAIFYHYARVHHSAVLIAPGLIALTAAIFSVLAVFRRTGYLTWGNAPDPVLDERQLAERNRAFSRSYATFVVGTFLAMTYYHIAPDARLWLPDRDVDFEPLYWGIMLFGTSLPSAMIAWFDRPPADEEA